MNLEQILCEKVISKLGEEFNVELNHVKRNNEQTFTALAIRKKGEYIAPNIYIGYHLYKIDRGEMTVDEAVEDIIKSYYEASESTGVDLEFLTDWERAKELLFVTLISKKRNRNRLKDIPYREYAGDIVITYRMLVNIGGKGTGTIQVNNELMQQWGVEESEIFEAAKVSSPKLFTVRTCSIYKLMLELLEENDKNDDMMDRAELEAILSEGSPIMVITNESRVWGAGAIVYSDALKEISDKYETDLYILPSSVHELVVVPIFNETLNADIFKKMVPEVNEEQVPNQDILSDSVFKYERETGRFYSLDEELATV